MLFDTPVTEKTLTFKELAQVLNVSTPTLKRKIEESLPFWAAKWYGKDKPRKRIYWPNETKIILETLS